MTARRSSRRSRRLLAEPLLFSTQGALDLISKVADTCLSLLSAWFSTRLVRTLCVQAKNPARRRALTFVRFSLPCSSSSSASLKQRASSRAFRTTWRPLWPHNNSLNLGAGDGTARTLSASLVSSLYLRNRWRYYVFSLSAVTWDSNACLQLSIYWQTSSLRERLSPSHPTTTTQPLPSPAPSQPPNPLSTLPPHSPAPSARS